MVTVMLQGACRGEELMDLIKKPTAKESATVEKFRTAGGPAVREYCPHLTKEDCCRWPSQAEHMLWKTLWMVSQKPVPLQTIFPKR